MRRMRMGMKMEMIKCIGRQQQGEDEGDIKDENEQVVEINIA